VTDRDWTVHPGQILAEALAERHLSQAAFARQVGLSTKHVCRIVNGKAGYSAAAAVRFEQVLGVPASLWLSLLAGYQEDVARGRKPV
jgi:addiction module HigA family antidote